MGRQRSSLGLGFVAYVIAVVVVSALVGTQVLGLGTTFERPDYPELRIDQTADVNERTVTVTAESYGDADRIYAVVDNENNIALDEDGSGGELGADNRITIGMLEPDDRVRVIAEFGDREVTVETYVVE